MLGENLLPIGVITKAGAPVDGKQIYELNDAAHNRKYTFSVPEGNADSFEKLYDENNAVMSEVQAPDVQEELTKQGVALGKKVKRNTIIGAITGLVIPAILAIRGKGSVLKRSILGVLGSVAGTFVGAWGTSYLSMRNGMNKLVKNNPSYQKLSDVAENVGKLGVEMKVETLA